MPRIVRCSLIQAANAASADLPLPQIKKTMMDKHVDYIAQAAKGGAQITSWDGAHQCIHIEGFKNPEDFVAASRKRITVTDVEKHAGNAAHVTPPIRISKVDEYECVGCNLCWLVCPVENCITMERVDVGVASQSWEQRTGASRC